MNKFNIKKHIRIISAILLASILLECVLMTYNLGIKYIFNKMKLINNDPITIEMTDITVNEEESNIYLSYNSNEHININNIELVLKNKNEDAYIRFIHNEGEEEMKKSNKDENSFKAYLAQEASMSDFKIVFPSYQINIENIDKIVVNNNIKYLPETVFSIYELCIIFIVLLSFYIFIHVYKKIKKMNIKKEKIFLFLGISLGLVFTFINIPLAKYDEHAHFWRAYELSCGIIKSGTQELPNSIFNIIIDNDGNYHIEEKTSYSYLKEMLNIELNRTEKNMNTVGATATLSPFSYIPQTLGCLIGNILNLKPIITVYLARISNLSFYIGIIYIAIKIMPKEKWKEVIMLIALFPMSLIIAASVSPDVTIISLSILLVSYILYLKFKKEKINLIDCAIMIILNLIVSMSKIVYIPMALLYFIIPKEKFTNKKQRILLFLITLLVFVGTYFIWQNIATGGVTIIRTSTTEQIYFTLSNIMRDVYTGINTIYKFSSDYYFTMIGGWNTQPIIVIIFSIILFITVFGKNNNEIDEQDNVKLEKREKILISIAVLISALLIFVGLYIPWTRACFTYVEGVQGRYFLPVLLPLILILEKNKFFYDIKNKNNILMYLIVLMYIPIFINTVSSYIK